MDEWRSTIQLVRSRRDATGGDAPAIGVLGDLMLTVLWRGCVIRTVPDAPAPVFWHGEYDVGDRGECHDYPAEEVWPGGAANLAKNVRSLLGGRGTEGRSRVRAFGLVGDRRSDLSRAWGDELRGALEGDGIDVSGVLSDAGRPTTLKISLLATAGNFPAFQKIARIDRERCDPLGADSSDAEIVAELSAAIRSGGPYSAFCISDFGKGTCSRHLAPPVIKMLGDRCETLVDPAPKRELVSYGDATCFLPNRSEARSQDRHGIIRSGQGTVEEFACIAASVLRNTSRATQCVIVKLDRDGAALVERGQSGGYVLTHIPAIAHARLGVQDVAGAGDAFQAGVAVGRSVGLDWTGSAIFGTLAAGVQISRLEGPGVTLSDIEAYLRSEHCVRELPSIRRSDIPEEDVPGPVRTN